MDSLFKALSASPIIPVAESQVAMTPDCFVCPLTPLRGALVNQALPVRGQLKGGNMGWHFLSKNLVQKVPQYIRCVQGYRRSYGSTQAHTQQQRHR